MTLKPLTGLFGLVHDTVTEFSVTLLKTMLEGGSGPRGQIEYNERGKRKAGREVEGKKSIKDKNKQQKYKNSTKRKKK